MGESTLRQTERHFIRIVYSAALGVFTYYSKDFLNKTVSYNCNMVSILTGITAVNIDFYNKKTFRIKDHFPTSNFINTGSNLPGIELPWLYFGDTLYNASNS
jgi:hypothetical protein